jgi:pSer/pThr/pTyr-binding forkhead associated (FHA) protein
MTKSSKRSVRIVLQRSGPATESYLCVLEAGIEPARIGRDEECAVRIMDRSVSRQHAELRVTDDGDLIVVDLGSLNGTKLNDAGVSRRPIHLVLPGDVLRFGFASEIRVVNVIEEAKPQPRAGGAQSFEGVAEVA